MNIIPDWQQVETLHGDKRPLNDDQRRVIDLNRHALVRLIETNRSTVEHLYANKCFNSQHKERIESGVDKFDRVDKLLDIMRRRSVADFNKLIENLYIDGQPRLAQMLKQGGGKMMKNITNCIKNTVACLLFG